MPGSGLWSPPWGKVLRTGTRLCPLALGSVPWCSALSPGICLCPLELSSVPGALLCPLAFCSVSWHSALSPCSLLGLLGKSGLSWDRHQRRARAVCDSPVNSMPHQIAKQQQQLIQQQHKINLLQQQIQVLMGGAQAEGGTGSGSCRERGLRSNPSSVPWA